MVELLLLVLEHFPDPFGGLSPEEKLLREIFGESADQDQTDQHADAETRQDVLEQQTRKVLATLTPREEQILRSRFGIGQKTGSTIEKVADQFAISADEIRQIEAKALRKLKQTGRSRNLEGFMKQE